MNTYGYFHLRQPSSLLTARAAPSRLLTTTFFQTSFLSSC